MSDVIRLSSHNVIELASLVDEDSAAVTGATVQATINDMAGNAVSGETWPLTLSHTTGGTYQGTASNSLSLTANKTYKVVITANNGGVIRTFNHDVVALA